MAYLSERPAMVLGIVILAIGIFWAQALMPGPTPDPPGPNPVTLSIPGGQFAREYLTNLADAFDEASASAANYTASDDQKANQALAEAARDARLKAFPVIDRHLQKSVVGTPPKWSPTRYAELTKELATQLREAAP